MPAALLLCAPPLPHPSAPPDLPLQDEMEFTEAESNMNDLVSEYQQASRGDGGRGGTGAGGVGASCVRLLKQAAASLPAASLPPAP